MIATAKEISGGDCHYESRYIDDIYWTIIRFSTADQAAAMEKWANDNNMHRRPATPAELDLAGATRAGEEELAIVDGLVTGTLRQVVRAWRADIAAGRNEHFAAIASQRALIAERPFLTEDEARRYAHAMICWARRVHGPWFRS